MSENKNNYVFLMDCSDLAEIQVVRSYLTAEGFHPRIRDEQTRGVAPHFGHLLGKLVLEIPEPEYIRASLLLKGRQSNSPETVHPPTQPDTEALAKKALWNSIIGCVLVPLIFNFYSLIISYRVIRQESPLGNVSRKRLLLALFFNSLSFYFWLTLAYSWIT